MDRQIVYPAQIPLDSDQLNAQRNAYVGLGQLAAMAYGWTTVSASGFTCTPSAGLSVTIAPGSLLAPGMVDGAAYGTLAAVGSILVRQYGGRDPVTLTVPGTGAVYTVYVTPVTIDTDDTVLPFYNAANPSVTYAGSGNSGATAPTVRKDLAQLGIGASVPAGAYPLWAVTVPAGATSITTDMIAQAAGAPFYDTIPQLQAAKQDSLGYIPVNGQWALGTTAYQVVGMNCQISDLRPAFFYTDNSGNQHAGGRLALYADVTAEQAARIAAVSNEATARANADAQLVSGKWALGTTAYQIIGMNWQIADGRPAVFYVDANGTQHAGGEIAMYSDVTAEQSARETAISDESVARANADAQLVSGRWALGTTAYQVVGLNWQIADARPAVFYQDSSGNQHSGGELMMNSDVTAGTIAASGQRLSGTWTNTRGILRQRFGVSVNAYPMAFDFPIEYGAAPQNVQLTVIPINNESDTLIVNLNGLCTTTGGQFWVVGIHGNQQESITGNCIVIIDVEAPA